jgi:PIN domain nuclease of toxin-antitoxin system
LTERLAAANFERLPVTCTPSVPHVGHPDPFDRLLIAQADIEPLQAGGVQPDGGDGVTSPRSDLDERAP